MPTPLFERLALIGVGLIGSSIARAARAQGAGRRDRRHRALGGDARARGRARPRRPGRRDQRRRRRADADLVIVCIPVGACGAVAARDRAASRAGRDRLRCRLGQGRGRRATWRRICPRACISSRRIRSPAPSIPGPDAGFAELFVNRWCILTPPHGADPAAVERLAAFWRALGANVETMTRRASRPRARDHQPPAAPHRLHHRRHRRRPRRRSRAPR